LQIAHLLRISDGTVGATRPYVKDIAEQLKERTMRFALRVMRFCRSLPDTWEGRHVRDQLFRSGSGVAANYHATCRARSHRDFISKMGVVVEESDETLFWLNFVSRADLTRGAEESELRLEAKELLAIFTQSAKTASANRH
jgi:four helix bundle protein